MRWKLLFRVEGSGSELSPRRPLHGNPSGLCGPSLGGSVAGARCIVQWPPQEVCVRVQDLQCSFREITPIVIVPGYNPYVPILPLCKPYPYVNYIYIYLYISGRPGHIKRT